MKFGLVPVEEAIGALAAHSVRAGETMVKKGTLVSSEIAMQLRQSGVATIIAARFEPGDITEDEAAFRLACALAGENVVVETPFTGRSNLYAETSGVLLIDVEAINGLNAVDEATTAATLPAYKPVVAGEMVGTVKIIPYAIPEVLLQKGIDRAGKNALRVAPYTRRSVGVVSTILPGLKPSVIDKTLTVLSKRLEPAHARILQDRRVSHDVTALALELAKQAEGDTQLIVVFGASAIADRRDVIPSAIEMAGGKVEHFGMPVDPGNLLLVGSIAGKPVVGAPGCARSPKENGFDWILHRLLADVPVTRADIMSLGVGGLLWRSSPGRSRVRVAKEEAKSERCRGYSSGCRARHPLRRGAKAAGPDRRQGPGSPCSGGCNRFIGRSGHCGNRPSRRVGSGRAAKASDSNRSQSAVRPWAFDITEDRLLRIAAKDAGRNHPSRGHAIREGRSDRCPCGQLA